MHEVYSFTVYDTYGGGLFYFDHLHLDLLIAALPLCISSYCFEFWVHIERHWLGMYILILLLNGALPLYNTILAYALHELSKAQSTMLLTYRAPALVLQAALDRGQHYVPRYLCSPVPMFPEPMFPGTYVPRYLCSPVPMFPEPMFPGTYVPR